MIDISDLGEARLRAVDAAVGERRGWDFSRVRDDRDPVPWDYMEVVRQYLWPEAQVLDIGTGGGERFRSLAPSYGQGVGIDISPEMVRVAQEDTPGELAAKVSFRQMPSEDLQFGDEAFDVVLSRHSGPVLPEVARVLRRGGRFVMQDVGPGSTRAICEVFGCGPGGGYGESLATIDEYVAAATSSGLQVECSAVYDVRYYVQDLESFVFWLKAVPLPEDFDIGKHWRQVQTLVRRGLTPRGVESNEQRLLLVARKP